MKRFTIALCLLLLSSTGFTQTARDYFKIGRQHIEAKAWQEAADAFGKAIEIKPDWAVAYTLRGRAYQAMGNWKEALENLDNALKYDDSHFRPWQVRAQVRDKMGDKEGAVADYTQMLERNPAHQSSRLKRLHLLYGLKRYQEALDDCEILIKAQPENVRLYQVEAMLFESLDRPKDAVSSYTKAIDLDGTNPKYYFNRGQIKLVLQDEKGSCKDFKKSVALGGEKAKDWLTFCEKD